MATIPTPDQLMSIGRVQSAYGIKGWVWIYANTEPTTNIFGYMPWYLQIGKEWREVEAIEWRTQGKGLVAQFKDCHDRNAAEALHGAVIWTAKQNLPDLSDADFVVRHYFCALCLRLYPKLNDFNGSVLMYRFIGR